MAKLDKNEWLSSDVFDFEECDGKVFAIKSESGSLIKVVKSELPDGSFTKFLIDKLNKEDLL